MPCRFSEPKMSDENRIPLQYDELSTDTALITKCEAFTSSLAQVRGVIHECDERLKNMNNLTVEDKNGLYVLLMFALNSLYWLHLRIQNVDTNTHPIKQELSRVKKLIKEWQQKKDLKNRPKLNTGAAKRFIRSGLYDPSLIGQGVNKKIKFNS